MVFTEIVETTRNKLSGIDVGGIQGKLAVQIDLTGRSPGTFYVEVRDGKLSVEPYEYNDRDALLTLSATNYLKLLERKLDPIVAATTGKLKVDGSIEKVLEFSKLIKN